MSVQSDRVYCTAVHRPGHTAPRLEALKWRSLAPHVNSRFSAALAKGSEVASWCGEHYGRKPRYQASFFFFFSICMSKRSTPPKCTNTENFKRQNTADLPAERRRFSVQADGAVRSIRERNLCLYRAGLSTLLTYGLATQRINQALGRI